MSNALTPGPWKKVYVGSSDWDLSGPVTEEDWQLASAAPELLEALQELFGADMEYCMQMDGKDDQLEAIGKARAAIQKATGAA